ncbi:MAG TPA: serine/threonine-protein kinase, partial [Chloroflexota bacterium]|nr:serine/threonine-protein kinase [Chloroflexota bacterium]
LKSKLVEYMPALARVRVEAAVVVTGAATLQLTGDGGYRVYRPDELLAFLEDPAEIGQRPSAIAELSGHIRRALYKWLRGPSGPLTFGPYEVIERLEQGDDEALYRARHRQMPGAPPVRLRVVTLSPYRLTPEQLAERRAALYREAEALLRMGSHPNVVAARDVFEEDGRVVLVMDTTEGRTLRQRLRDGTPLTLEERLNILFDVSQALAHAHAHGVVHRQVEPSNILLGDDGVTRLAQFGLAKIMDSGVATVWHADTPDAVDVHYLAPELMNLPGDAVTPSTDLFELGVVGFELFSGRLPFERPSDAFSGLPPLPAGASKELTDLFAHLLRGDPAARPVDAREVLGTLARLRSDEGRRIVTGPKNEYSPGDTIDGKFEVRERLGGGGFSTVYRVYWAIEDREYALKVFNQDVPYEKVQREIAMLRAISHPRVVQAVWADRTSSGQWYLVSELIQGETLEAYTDGRKRLSVAEAVALTCQLLSALEAIHPNAQRRSELEEVARSGDLTPEQFEELQALRAQGIVHRDIKPQNLMLTSAGIVLIDFNIATQVGKPVNTMSSTPPYQCPDIIPGVDVWDVSPDLFASGVVLYELLCAEHPYENRHPRVDRQPRDPREFRPELSPDLAEFLLRACSPRRDMRFTTAREMRAALEAIDPLVVAPVLQVGSSPPSRLAQLLADAPPNVNPMVREFLALSSQARRSNRGTRGLDELADATYVETALDSRLSASVLSGQFRLVIVTGNAGDGKTAFIQQLEKAARQAGAQVVDTSKNGARLLYGGCDIVTLYDGSQDEAERTSDEVLTAFFEPFAAHRAPSVGPSMVRIAAINEGRLRDYLMTHRADYAGFAVDVIAALDDPGSSQLPGDIAVVNLNLRSVTHGGPKSIFSRQLRTIVQGPFWEPCDTCDHRVRCPIKHNIDTFRDPTYGPATTERLRVLVDLIRLRRRRHLTMRDVRSLISHLLFRDRVCEEIPGILEDGDPFAVIDLAYFQGPGGLGV